MSDTNFHETYWRGVAAGTSRSNSTTEQSLFPANRPTLYGGYFKDTGKALYLKAFGVMSNIVTTPGTLTLRIKAGSVAIWDSGAIPLNTTAKTSLPWMLEVWLRATTLGTGTAGKVTGLGRFQAESILASPAAASGGSSSYLLPVTTVAEGGGFDMEAAQLLDLTEQFSVANSGNLIQMHYGEIISP